MQIQRCVLPGRRCRNIYVKRISKWAHIKNIYMLIIITFQTAYRLCIVWPQTNHPACKPVDADSGPDDKCTCTNLYTDAHPQNALHKRGYYRGSMYIIYRACLTFVQHTNRVNAQQAGRTSTPWILGITARYTKAYSFVYSSSRLSEWDSFYVAPQASVTSQVIYIYLYIYTLYRRIDIDRAYPIHRDISDNNYRVRRPAPDIDRLCSGAASAETDKVAMGRNPAQSPSSPAMP